MALKEKELMTRGKHVHSNVSDHLKLLNITHRKVQLSFLGVTDASYPSPL